MITVIGWLAVAFVGAYIVGAITLFLGTGGGLGGLESLPAALIGACVVVVMWLGLVFWLSPLTLSIQ